MIGKLKKIIKKKTYRVVARELGYNSGSTVLHWVNNKKIPSNMKASVKKYIEENL